MAILNYTTTIPAEKSVSEIMAKLAKHGVRNINMEFENGQPSSIQFTFVAPDGTPLLFRLEENSAGVLKALQKDSSIKNTYKNQEQARRVAWRIKKDFIEAQLALVEAGLVTLPELFIGDLVVNPTGQRLIEKFATIGAHYLIDK